MSIDDTDANEAFTYDGGAIEPGERAKFQYSVSETYLGDPVRVPVTIINGDEPGPTCVLTAAIHGDELNGIEVVREVADEWDHTELNGTVVCLPVMNAMGFLAQERYLPIYDRDLNRAFPGKADSTSAYRIAQTLYENFIAPCDFGIDFHTSTRGRTNMFQVRADMSNEAVRRLAWGFGSNVIISSEGSEGMLRREATRDGIPTITVEMGEAHRFQRDLIDDALAGIRSVFAEYGLHPQEAVRWPGWRTVVDGWDERTWVRADTGGIVEMHNDQGDLIHKGDVICTITTPFNTETETVEAPFTGLLAGILENPVVYPGNPLCHLAELDSGTVELIEQYAGNDAT